MLLTRGLDRFDPGDVGRDVLEVLRVLVDDQRALVRAVLVEELDALVDVFTSTARKGRGQIGRENEDGVRLGNVGRGLADVQPVVDIRLAELNERKAPEAVRGLQEIADRERDRREQARGMHLHRHDVPSVRLVPVRLERVRRLVVVRADPHRLDRSEAEKLQARHLERRGGRACAEAEIGLQFVAVVSAAGVEIEVRAPKAQGLDDVVLDLGLRLDRFELVLERLDAVGLVNASGRLELDPLARHVVGDGREGVHVLDALHERRERRIAEEDLPLGDG